MNPTAAPDLQLNDIVMPDSVGFWPPAPGWWIIAGLIIVFLLAGWLLLRWRHKRRQAKQPLSDALQQLHSMLSEEPALTPELCATINETLKIYCRQRYPKALALYGSDWSAFLRQHSQAFTDNQQQLLASGPYLPPEKISGSAAELLQSAQQWLQGCEQQYKPGSADHA